MITLRLALVFAVASSTYISKDEANGFLRVKRSTGDDPQQNLQAWFLKTNKGPTSKSSGKTCRDLTSEEILLRKNTLVAVGRGLDCVMTWETYADQLEENKSIPKSEYKAFDECVETCRGEDGFGFDIFNKVNVGRKKCKAAKKEYNREYGIFNNQPIGSMKEPQMKMFCTKCIKHIPKHYDVKDTNTLQTRIMKMLLPPEQRDLADLAGSIWGSVTQYLKPLDEIETRVCE